MVLNNIFGKKNSNSDIDSLKERFSQVSSDKSINKSSEQNISSNRSVSVQDTLSDNQLSNNSSKTISSSFQNQSTVQQAPFNQAPVQQPIQSSPQPEPFGQQPMSMPTQVTNPQQMMPNQAPIQQQAVPSQPSVPDLPSWAVESTGEEIANNLSSQENISPSNNAATETLEQIEDKYYDAKLNSLIIDQVKELIEIDNNLNSKIEDLSSEMKKEISEREKLAKKVDQHFDKVKELEQNMEKFLGLYEMVTNQFNPFVDKSSTQLFLDEKDQKDSPVVQDPKTAPKIQDKVAILNDTSSGSSTSVNDSSNDAMINSLNEPQPTNSSKQMNDDRWSHCPIHHAIHPSLHFELKNGQKLSSIYDVLAVLEKLDDNMFSEHVSLTHNDFSQWIYKVLGLTDLGQQLDLIKTKPEMIQSIRSYIRDKMKDSNQ